MKINFSTLTSVIITASMGILFSVAASAHMRGLLILSKTAENSGNGIYMIEQEVQFPTAQEPVVLKETWWIESDNNMRLYVTGTKELKDSIRMSFTYSNGQKTFTQNNSRQSQKISNDFFERFFHFRSSERWANLLVQMKLVPGNILYRKPVRSAKEIENQVESFVRLSRFGGVINYAIGTPTPAQAAESSPGLWIAQDDFEIRKIILPTQVEVTAERYSQYQRGLHFPRKRTVRWSDQGGDNSVQIQTLNVVSKPAAALPTIDNNRTVGLNTLVNKNVVEEFYRRFR